MANKEKDHDNSVPCSRKLSGKGDEKRITQTAISLLYKFVEGAKLEHDSEDLKGIREDNKEDCEKSP